MGVAHNGHMPPGFVPETDAVKRILAIGLGGMNRSDEGAGIRVVRAIHAQWPEAVRVFEHGGEGASLMNLWAPGDGVFVFAAVSSGGKPGTLYRFEATIEPLPRRFFRPLEHAFGLAEAVQAAKSIGRLPTRLVVYGVEGERFAEGDELSDAVCRAVQDLTYRALAEVRSLAERALALYLAGVQEPGPGYPGQCTKPA